MKDEVFAVCVWLVKKLCLDTNATKATYSLDGLTGKSGEPLGDWEIVIKKKGKRDYSFITARGALDKDAV